MKNLWINKEKLISLVLAGSISLCTCACGNSNNKKESDTTTEIIDVVEDNTELTNSTEYISKSGYVVDLTELNDGKYRSLEGDNRYTILPGTSIYYTDGYNVTYEEVTNDSFIVTVLESNDSYSYTLFSNNTKGYVLNSSLIKCANLSNGEYIMVEENKEDILLTNAYLYGKNGMYIGYVCENENCNVIATNGEYTLISLSDGRQGYVLNRSLTNNHKEINGYGYIRSGMPVYSNINLTDVAYNIPEDQLIYVQYINEKYASIIDNDSNMMYVRTSELDKDFIVIDLNTQRMDCYLDYQLSASWGTRSGKDSTPTHTGSFDIDWKATDWEFTNYPGSHARYWIPINEYGEGIHDLVGDDEQNYGNEAYHAYGSHGCIRVPRAASEFVYENYEVGDMVLVRKR